MNLSTTPVYNPSDIISTINSRLSDKNRTQLTELIRSLLKMHENHYLKSYSLKTDRENLYSKYNDTVTESCINKNTKLLSTTNNVFWCYWEEPSGYYPVPHVLMKIHRLKRNYSEFKRQGDTGFVAGVRNVSSSPVANTIYTLSSIPSVNKLLYINSEPNTGMSTFFMSLTANTLHVMSTPGSVINYYNNWVRHYFNLTSVYADETSDYKNPVFCVDMYSEDECKFEFEKFVSELKPGTNYTVLCSYEKLQFASTLSKYVVLNLDDFGYYVYNQGVLPYVREIQSNFVFVNALSNTPFDRRLLPEEFLQYLPVVLDWYEGANGVRNTEHTRRDVAHLPVSPTDYSKVINTLVHFASSSVIQNVKNIFVIDSLEQVIASVESNWEYYRNKPMIDPVSTVSFAYPETPENNRLLSELSYRTGHNFEFKPVPELLDMDGNTTVFTTYDNFMSASLKKDTMRNLTVKIFLVTDHLNTKFSVSRDMARIVERVRTDESEDSIVKTILITQTGKTELEHILHWYNTRPAETTPISDIMNIQRLKNSLEVISTESVSNALQSQSVNINVVPTDKAITNIMNLDTEMPTYQNYSTIYGSLATYKNLIKLYENIATGKLQYDDYARVQIHNTIRELPETENTPFYDLNEYLRTRHINENSNAFYYNCVPMIARFGSEKLFEYLYETLQVTEYCATVRETSSLVEARRLANSAIYQFECKHGRKYEPISAKFFSNIIRELYLKAGYFIFGIVLSKYSKDNGLFKIDNTLPMLNSSILEIMYSYPIHFYGYPYSCDYDIRSIKSVEDLKVIYSIKQVSSTDIQTTYYVSMRNASDIDFSFLRLDSIPGYTDTPEFEMAQTKGIECHYQPVKPRDYIDVELLPTTQYSLLIEPTVYDVEEINSEHVVHVEPEKVKPVTVTDSDGNQRVVPCLPEEPYYVQSELYYEYLMDAANGKLALSRKYQRIVDDIQQFEPKDSELSFFQLLRKYDYKVEPLHGFEQYFEYSSSPGNRIQIGDLEDIILDEFSLAISETGFVSDEHCDTLMSDIRNSLQKKYSIPEYEIVDDVVYKIENTTDYSSYRLKPNGLELIRNKFISMYGISEKIDFDSNVEDSLLSYSVRTLKYTVIDDTNEYIESATKEIDSRITRLQYYNNGHRTGIFYTDNPELLCSLPDREDTTWYEHINGVKKPERFEQKWINPNFVPVLARKFNNSMLQALYDGTTTNAVKAGTITDDSDVQDTHCEHEEPKISNFTANTLRKPVESHDESSDDEFDRNEFLRRLRHQNSSTDQVEPELLEVSTSSNVSDNESDADVINVSLEQRCKDLQDIKTDTKAIHDTTDRTTSVQAVTNHKCTSYSVVTIHQEDCTNNRNKDPPSLNY